MNNLQKRKPKGLQVLKRCVNSLAIREIQIKATMSNDDYTGNI